MTKLEPGTIAETGTALAKLTSYQNDSNWSNIDDFKFIGF